MLEEAEREAKRAAVREFKERRAAIEKQRKLEFGIDRIDFYRFIN